MSLLENPAAILRSAIEYCRELSNYSEIKLQQPYAPRNCIINEPVQLFQTGQKICQALSQKETFLFADMLIIKLELTELKLLIFNMLYLKISDNFLHFKLPKHYTGTNLCFTVAGFINKPFRIKI